MSKQTTTRNELKKELQNISTLYNLDSEEKKDAHKTSGEKTLNDELNNLSRLYNLDM